MYDIAVIGAGVVGAVTARRLAAYNLRICVLEKGNDAAIGASKANSAIVHAGFDAETGTLKAKLNVRGSELMETLAGELGVKYKRIGALVIGFDDSDRKKIEELYGRGKANGVKRLEVLDRGELFRKEPAVSEQAVCALYAPTSAVICPYELAVAALGNAMDNGADFKRNFEVTNITENNGVYKIYSSNEYITARYVINAAGLYADKIAELAGDKSIKIHPRRGEYILLDKDCGGLVKHTIFRTPGKMGKGILITPTVDGNLLFGPTSVDLTDKTDLSVTAAGLKKIAGQAGIMIRNPHLRQTITSFCGLRAVGSTGDFIINSPKRGFINAAGIESPGLSASPAIAEYIEGLLKGQGLKLIPRSDYIARRSPSYAFRNADTAAKNEMIKKDPSYGRVICRCEGITEGEIINAVRQNPGARDLDGIKRRTRAQMGRCQGGFCMPYIMDILSRELGIPYEEITKSGGGSWIIREATK